MDQEEPFPYGWVIFIVILTLAAIAVTLLGCNSQPEPEVIQIPKVSPKPEVVYEFALESINLDGCVYMVESCVQTCSVEHTVPLEE